MRRTAGLTLVELMIAIALMLIMTLQLQIVFGQSRQLYLAADALAQVYQNARGALDQIEKDVANAVLTDQMDFFNDNRTQALGVGHYAPGEENAGMRGKLHPSIPYVNAMAFRQRKDYTPKDAHKVGGPYRLDEMYFRTFTMVGGRPREAIVRYRLDAGLDPYTNPRPRPVLQRIITAPKLKGDGTPSYSADGYPELETLAPQDMCYYVQEFRIDLFIRNSRRKTVGRFYSPKEAATKGTLPDDPKPPGLANLLASGGADDVIVQCLDGKQAVDANARLNRSDGKLYLRNDDGIPHLAAGDRLYIRTPHFGPTPGGWDFDFKNSYVTIKKVDPLDPSGSNVVVSFEEEPAILQLISGAPAYVPPEMEVMYRGGWLPQAIRVSMKIKDQRNEEIRTIQRIYQLLRS